MTPGLLISVRDAAEAQLALCAGADLIDVKEPLQGSLGAATENVIAEVASIVGDQKPISVALGELLSTTGRLSNLPPGVAFAKVGLAGCGRMPDWAQQWRRLIESFPPATSPVAVVYADWFNTEAPSPAEVLHHGRSLGCRALLLDTHQKTAGGLFDWWSAADIARLIHQARQAGLRTVVGGSLTEATIPRALELKPDFIAVRGAACQGDRASSLDGQRIRRLAATIHGASSKSPTHQRVGVAPAT